MGDHLGLTVAGSRNAPPLICPFCVYAKQSHRQEISIYSVDAKHVHNNLLFEVDEHVGKEFFSFSVTANAQKGS